MLLTWNCLLSLVLPLALALDSTTQIYPATVEVDLVFPRNDTYAPTALMPIVFAIQNAPAVLYLGFSINWYIKRVGSQDWLAEDTVDLTGANFSNNTYFSILSTDKLVDTEGYFSFLWEVASVNCTKPEYVMGGSSLRYNSTKFTIKNGAKQPDLIIGPNTCPSQSFTYNLTEMLPSPWYGFDGLDYCPVLSDVPPPPATPCAIKIDDALASQFSATMTATACSRSPSNLANVCSTSSSKRSVATRPNSEIANWKGAAAGLLLTAFFLPNPLLGAVFCFSLLVKGEEAKLNFSPTFEGNRTGTWTSLDCTNAAVEGPFHFLSPERWAMMDCDSAWRDAISIWKTIDSLEGDMSFVQSLANTFRIPYAANCGSLISYSSCSTTIVCNAIRSNGSGPASYEIWNSLATIHQMYKNYNYNFKGFEQEDGVDYFDGYFGSLSKPDDEVALHTLLDLIRPSAILVAAPYFNTYLASMPAMRDTWNETSFAIVSTIISVVKELKIGSSSIKKWTPQKQANMQDYQKEVIKAYGNITQAAIANLFNGSDSSIATLTALISNGSLIEGSLNGTANTHPEPPSDGSLQIDPAFFANVIPAAWSLSGVAAFVLDAGYPCGKPNPLRGVLSDETAEKTYACYNGSMYYLVYPNGESKICMPPCSNCLPSCIPQSFSMPPGLDKLARQELPPYARFGKLSVQSFVNGSVRTYQNNGNKNGVSVDSVLDGLNKFSMEDWYKNDITTPGFIRLPVCSAEEAYENWNRPGTRKTNLNYPCNP